MAGPRRHVAGYDVPQLGGEMVKRHKLNPWKTKTRHEWGWVVGKPQPPCSVQLEPQCPMDTLCTTIDCNTSLLSPSLSLHHLPTPKMEWPIYISFFLSLAAVYSLFWANLYKSFSSFLSSMLLGYISSVLPGLNNTPSFQVLAEALNKSSHGTGEWISGNQQDPKSVFLVGNSIIGEEFDNSDLKLGNIDSKLGKLPI